MTDMLERAAEAMRWLGFDKDTRQRAVKMAFGAALNPEDEALVHIVRDAIAQTGPDADEAACAAIAALKTYTTQGEL